MEKYHNINKYEWKFTIRNTSKVFNSCLRRARLKARQRRDSNEYFLCYYNTSRYLSNK